MAVLYLVRNRARRLSRSRRRRRGEPAPAAPTALFAVLLAGSVVAGCAPEPDPEYLPDEVLREELGLTDDDRVHSVSVTGGAVESATPALDSVPTGAWVQFVSGDWLVHEVAFELDSLGAAARGFLERTDQVASPPLVSRGARFVVSLEGAPGGRYPYRLEGNGSPGRGVIVVLEEPPG